jgi:hypothetical protein
MVVCQDFQNKYPGTNYEVHDSNLKIMIENSQDGIDFIKNYWPGETDSVAELRSFASEQPQDLSSEHVRNPTEVSRVVSNPPTEVSTRSVDVRERFRPIASPTEEYELDAELFRLRRSFAKIEKSLREFVVFARTNLTERQIHRLERIMNYTQKVRYSIQPDL